MVAVKRRKIKTSADLFKALTGKDVKDIPGAELAGRLRGDSGPSGGSSAPRPKPKPLPPKPTIKIIPKASGVSSGTTVQDVRRNARLRQQIINEARRRNINISTRVRQIGFFNQLRQESKTPIQGPVRPVQDNGRPILTVEEFKPEFETQREEILFNIEREQARLRQKKQRQGDVLSVKEEAKLLKLESQRQIVSLSLTLKGLSDLGKAIKKNPKTVLEELPSAIKEQGRLEGQTIRLDNGAFVVKIAGQVFGIVAFGKVLKLIGKVSPKITARLNPKFKGIKKNVLTIPSGQKGKKFLDIEIGGTVKKLSEPLATQAKLVGKKVNAVSAQAQKLVGIIKRKRIIRKPIPGEDKFSKPLKKLLSKFDRGQITAKQITILDRKIRKATKGAGNLLERSFFADPKGRLRPSRLGLQDAKDASLLDLLAGDVSFKSKTPQALIFEDVLVSKFPKTTIFKSITKKLKGKNPQLTPKEAEALLKFQLKPTGKFKPLGALSREPEITLAPGEIVKKGKTLAVTLINGKKVSIVSAKIVKATKKTKKLLKDLDKGKLKKGELKELKKRLRKETGFKNTSPRSVKRRPRVRARPVPRIRPRRRVARAKRVVRRGRVPPRNARGRFIPRPAPRAPRAPPRRVVRRVPPRTPPRVPSRPRLPPRRIPRKGIPVPFPKLKPGKVSKKKPKKPTPVFDIFGKKGKKFVKISKKPLTREDAKSRGLFAIDNTVAKTFKIVPTGRSKKPARLRRAEQNYFKKFGNKVRAVKIRKGKKFALKDKFIEKRRYGIDKIGEKRGLSLSKFLKQRRTGSRKPVSRISKTKGKKRTRVFIKKRVKRVSPKIKMQRIKSLIKARRVLKQRRKRK